MFTKILDLDNYNLSNDTGEKNIKIKLNDWRIIDNAEMYYDLWFDSKKINSLSHNALILPNWRVIIYFKKLRNILDKEALTNIMKGIFKKLPKDAGILIHDWNWEQIKYDTIEWDLLKEESLIEYFGD